LKSRIIAKFCPDQYSFAFGHQYGGVIAAWYAAGMSPTDMEREAIATTRLRKFICLPLRATIALPDLLLPVEFDGKRLLDGGLLDNLHVDSEF
jgi:predicted acylesterase/phospholipase RssA